MGWIGLDSWSRLKSVLTKILWHVHDTMFNIPWSFQGDWLPRSYKIQAKHLKPMLNSYHPNDKFPADVQSVYVTTCMTPGFFQDLWRTIRDAIFVCIVTSRVYITSMFIIHLAQNIWWPYNIILYYICDNIIIIIYDYWYSAFKFMVRRQFVLWNAKTAPPTRVLSMTTLNLKFPNGLSYFLWRIICVQV